MTNLARRFIQASGLVFFLLLCAAAPAFAQATQPLTVGAVLPITGTSARAGTYWRNGLELGVATVNERGGVKGRPIVLKIEDNASVVERSVTSYRKLVDTDQAAAVFAGISGHVLALSPVANETKRILINASGQSPKIRSAGPYTFTVINDASVQAEQMAEFVFNKLKISEVGIIYTDTDTGVGPMMAFEAMYSRLGGKVVAKEGHGLQNFDLRSHLRRIKEKNVKAVLVLTHQEFAGPILQQGNEVGLNVQWIGLSTVATSTLLNSAGKLAEGFIAILPEWTPGTTSARVKEFVQAYRSRFGSDPDIYAAHFYDSVFVFAKAATQAADSTPEALRVAMLAIRGSNALEGVAGTIDFNDQGWVRKPQEIVVVRNGAYVPFAKK